MLINRQTANVLSVVMPVHTVRGAGDVRQVCAGAGAATAARGCGAVDAATVTRVGPAARARRRHAHHTLLC